MSDKQTTSWLSNAFLLIGAVLVAYLIWSLAVENRELKARIAEMQQGPPVDGLQAGDALADVSLTSVDEGEEAALATLVDGGGVAVFLTTTCPYCKQTLPIWDELATVYQERGVPFVGVSFDDAAATAAYRESEGIRFPLWVVTDPAEAPETRVPSVPFTALVRPDGTVSHAWLGVLSDDAQQTLSTALDEALADSGRLLSGSSDQDPGCCPASAPGTGAGR